MKRFFHSTQDLARAPQLAVLALLDVALEVATIVLFTEYPGLHNACRMPCKNGQRSTDYVAKTIVILADRLRGVIADYRRLLEREIQHDTCRDSERDDYPF